MSDLKITGKRITFTQHEATDAEGQACAVDYETQVDAGPGGAGTVQRQGQLPGIVRYETTAGALADGSKTACGVCSHWDQKAWTKMVRDADSPLATAEDRQTITQARTRLIKAFGVEQAEEALRQFGICKVMTEIIHGWVKRDPIHYPAVTFQSANCPTYVSAGLSPLGIPNRIELVTPASPHGLFKARDVESQVIGDKRRDTVLYDAAGKMR